jgi:hypothetical protein
MSVPETNFETVPAPDGGAALPPPPPPAPGPPPVEPRQRVIAWLILVLAVVLILVGASPFWAPGLSRVLPWGRAGTDEQQAAAQKQTTDDIAAQQTRLDHDETAIMNLSRRAAQLEAAGADSGLKDLTDRVARLEAHPAEAPPPAISPDTAAALGALKDQVAQLTTNSAQAADRIVKLETQIANAQQQDQGERALLLALANLRIAVSGSMPFSAELDAVKAMARDRPELQAALAPLDDAAAAGIPSLAALATRFDRDIAPAILRASSETESADWGDQILARLKRLVVVRRIAPTGAESDDPVQAPVAKADAALKSGDLAGATAALDTLTGPAAKAASGWLAAAKTRVAAEAALNKAWQGESARAAATKAAAP